MENGTMFDDYYEYSNVSSTKPIHPIKVAISTFVAILSVIGFIGNICMMYAILRHKHMRNAPNILIFNLAVADLLYIVVTTPIYVEHELHPTSDLSTPLCKIKNYLECVAQYASVFALAALSRERCMAITGGIEARHQGNHSCLSSSKCVVGAVWLFSLTLSVPTLFFAHTKSNQCRSSSDDVTVARIYECVRLLLGYLIPLVVVGFFYVKIAISLFRSTQRFLNEYVTDAMAHQARVRKRLAASVLVITIFFTICWFPYFFYYIWINFAPMEEYILQPFPSTPELYRYTGLVMPVVNTCLDPWLLFVISSRHRACLVGCFRCNRLITGNHERSTREASQTTRRQQTSRGGRTSFSRL